VTINHGILQDRAETYLQAPISAAAETGYVFVGPRADLPKDSAHGGFVRAAVFDNKPEHAGEVVFGPSARNST
jgi:hypothetical protein